MPSTGDAPLNLLKPEQGEVVNLSVINFNYDTINDYAVDNDARVLLVEELNTAQGVRLNSIESLNTAQNTRLTNIESLNTTQNGRLDSIEADRKSVV